MSTCCPVSFSAEKFFSFAPTAIPPSSLHLGGELQVCGRIQLVRKRALDQLTPVSGASRHKRRFGHRDVPLAPIQHDAAVPLVPSQIPVHFELAWRLAQRAVFYSIGRKLVQCQRQRLGST